MQTRSKLSPRTTPEKFETEAIKISVLCYEEVEKFNVLLECLLPYTYPIIYQNVNAVGFRTLVNQINFYLS